MRARKSHFPPRFLAIAFKVGLVQTYLVGFWQTSPHWFAYAFALCIVAACAIELDVIFLFFPVPSSLRRDLNKFCADLPRPFSPLRAHFAPAASNRCAFVIDDVLFVVAVPRRWHLV